MMKAGFLITAMYRAVACFMLCVLILSSCQSEPVDTIRGNLAIIPMPVSMDTAVGQFIIDGKTILQMDEFEGRSFDPVAVFRQEFAKKSGYELTVSIGEHKSTSATHVIHISKVDAGMKPEQYELRVTENGIAIKASHEQGVFYAMQTLRQMMRLDAIADFSGGSVRAWQIPAVSILDQPAFEYRGMHLDVCRHFMPLAFVKKYIDLLAYYKMNRFHWHLTEDQGWRIEIKKYPRLQEVAAWRDQTLVGHYRETPDVYDGKRHGGYYTQEQVKEVVQYAAERGVMVIPEIEMPGHSVAALAAYPKLACFPDTFKVVQTWGVFPDVYCPRETTFTFLQNVLDEVVALFPSPYIHIGGDECPKTRWKACPHCQELIRRENLVDENGLQSYFIRRIEQYLNAKGKKIIGWDEILEGGLAPNATVMSWRGMKGGVEAAQSGHDVIMTPGSHCYFDYYQADPATEPIAIGGMVTLEKVYSFHPVPPTLTPEEAMHVLGGQANLWTEYIATPEHAMYMSYPRALALSEALWTPSERKSWPGFLERLNRHTDRLDGMQVNYARHFKLLLPSEPAQKE